MDPHSAIAYLGLKQHLRAGQTGVFLATAHPAKFREIVEPVIGTTIETPGPLAEALAGPRQILRIDATRQAVAEVLDA
jgi:threonine synthase